MAKYTTDTIPTEGWAFQRNKRGITHVTNVRVPYYGSNSRGDVGWVDSDQLKSFPSDELFLTEDEALNALRDLIAEKLEKARKAYDKLFALKDELDRQVLAKKGD